MGSIQQGLEQQALSAQGADSAAGPANPVVHDAGQVMLPTVADVEKGPWHDPGRAGEVAVTAFRLQAETLLHDGLPLPAVRPRLLPGAARSPGDDQVRYFMGDRVGQKVIEVFFQELSIQPEAGQPATFEHGLSGATTAQGKVDLCHGQVDAIMASCQAFCPAYGDFGLMQ